MLRLERRRSNSWKDSGVFTQQSPKGQAPTTAPAYETGSDQQASQPLHLIAALVIFVIIFVAAFLFTKVADQGG